MKFKVFLLFYVFISCSVATKECLKNGLHSIYKELMCDPIFEGESKCPTKYNCSTFETRDKSQCYFNGEKYQLQTDLPSDSSRPCSISCTCMATAKSSEPYFSCLEAECPEYFGAMIDPECIRIYEHRSCCAIDIYCGNSTELYKCPYDGNVYLEGQKFYPEKDSSKYCICLPGFSGELVEPFCKDIMCDSILHSGYNINKGCTPVYFGQDRICPIDWLCPDKRHRKIIGGPVRNTQTTGQCSFGEMLLNYNDSIDTGDDMLVCTCLLPPYVTCVKIDSIEQTAGTMTTTTMAMK